jgi:hypothetical protein
MTRMSMNAGNLSRRCCVAVPASRACIRVGGIRNPYRVDGAGNFRITELWLDTGAAIEKEH